MAKTNIYLGLEFGTGTLYEYSKVEKEGFEKHVSTKNNISYRKYYKMGAFGYLRGISVRSSNIGDQLSIALEGAGDKMYYINIGLRDGNQGIDTYAASVISFMPNLIVGEPYKVQPYAMERKDNPDKKNYGFSFKYANIETEEYDPKTQIGKLSFSYYKDGEVVEGDVPAGIWKKRAGKDFLDTTDRDEYLWNILEEYKVETTSDSKGTYTHTPGATQSATAKTEPNAEHRPAPAKKVDPKPAVVAKEVEEVEVEEEDDDDLPF